MKTQREGPGPKHNMSIASHISPIHSELLFYFYTKNNLNLEDADIVFACTAIT
jgi:hypothetical protein